MKEFHMLQPNGFLRGGSRLFALMSVLSTLLAIDPAHSTPAELCKDAAQHAAQSSNVPLDVLLAISLTETGRKRAGDFEPWPWTVNMEGAGKWFDARSDALTYVMQNFKRGARSFDVGCFQINYKWHGEAFSSIDEMFDPKANAVYAAKFLTELFSEFGSWSMAAGAFHSRTPKFAKRYRARFDRIRSQMPAASERVYVRTEAATVSSLEHVNRFPLLRQSGQSISVGSLVRLENVSVGGRFIQLVNARDPRRGE